MKIIKKNENPAKAIEEIKLNARTNGSKLPMDFMFALEKYNALVYFRVEKNELFRSPRLKNSYHLGIFFVKEGQLLPFHRNDADKIIKLFFGTDIEKVWEKESLPGSTLVSQMKNYDLFIAVPYGYAAIYLDPVDMKELVTSRYALYDSKEFN